MNILHTMKAFQLLQLSTTLFFLFDGSMDTPNRLYGNNRSSKLGHLRLLSEFCWPHKVHSSKVRK